VSTSGKYALFLLTLAASTLFAQNQTTPPQGSGSPTVVVSPPSVYVVAGGVYGTGVAVIPPATLPTQNTGISLANQAGISLTAPLQTGVTSALPSTAGLGYGTPAYGTPAYSGVAGGATTGEAGSEPGRAIVDLGPSYYGGAVAPEGFGNNARAGAEAATASAATPSLAEIAAYYKTRVPQSVRMYTNADASRMVSSVKGGTSSTTVPAANAPVQMAQSSGAPPTTQPGTAPSSSSSSNQPAQNPPPGSTSAATSTGQNQTRSESSSATTPQVNQPAQNAQPGQEKLPATASLLPFLSFLGLLSGAAGFWIMKLRK
jgi:hypothetical protein